MPELGTYHLYCEGDVPLLFTENETNHARLLPDYPNTGPYVKDGINDYVVHGRREAVNPERQGTKAAAHYRLKVGPGQSATVRAAPHRPGSGRSRTRQRERRRFGQTSRRHWPPGCRRPMSSTSR